MMFFDVSRFYQVSFQDSATYAMEMIIQLHNYVMFFNVFIVIVVVYFFFEIIAVSQFVNWLHTYKSNDHKFFFKILSSTYKKTHNSMRHMAVLEILWTLLPMIILVCIALPSLSMLYYFSLTFEPSLIVQVIGHQWYWSYEFTVNGNCFFNDLSEPFQSSSWHNTLVLPYNELTSGYPDVNSFTDIIGEVYYDHFPKNEEALLNAYKLNTYKIVFDSIMLQQEDLYDYGFRLLEVDVPLYLPIDTTIKIFLSSDDVLHSWAIPSLGIKVDCVPGRLNTVEFKIARAGIFYGQCSEICGTQHGFMPICIVALSKRCFFI